MATSTPTYTSFDTKSGTAYFQKTDSGLAAVNDPTILKQLQSGTLKTTTSTSPYSTKFNSSVATPSLTPSKTITSAQLQTPPILNPVSPATVSPYPVKDLFTTPQLQATPQETLASNLSTRIQSLNDSLVGQSQYQSQIENKYNVPSLITAQNDLSTQLQGIKNEAAAIPLQLQQGASDRGVTLPVLGRQENSRLRTNAIAALGVSTLLEASRGNLATAQNLADRAVSQKYDPIRERIAAATANLNLILNDPKTTLQDKNRAQAQLDIQNQKAYDLQKAEADSAEIYKISNSAAANGSDFAATSLYPTLSLALSAIQKAPDKGTAMQIASDVGLLSGAVSSMSPDEYNKLLTVTEARTLGVPYGTTRGEAADMDLTPTYRPSGGGTSGGGTSTPKYTATERAQLSDYLTQVSSYSSRQEALADLSKYAAGIKVQLGQVGYDQVAAEIDRQFPAGVTKTTAYTQPNSTVPLYKTTDWIYNTLFK